MNKLTLLVLNLILTNTVFSKNYIDFYGINNHLSSEIEKKYGKEIDDIVAKELIINKKRTLDDSDQKLIEKIYKEKSYILDKIKKENNFLYVKDDTAFYPTKNDTYTTIEVIKKNEPGRLRFINNVAYKINKHKNHDLIDDMIDFSHLSMQLMITKKLDLKIQRCPVYYCTTGFNHPKLKPYLTVFNNGVLQNRTLVIDTLNNDNDPTRREAAAFLIGHFNNPKEIITLLLPHINDSNDGVRNSVIQVIFGTMGKAHIRDIPIQPFLNLLDSPFVTDRNTALCVLVLAAQSNHARDVIIKQVGRRLITLLQLKQPNNHEPAYQLLQQLSGKNFDEHNYIAWRKWLLSVQFT